MGTVIPGERISDDGFMRGHGTVVANGQVVACVAGRVERVNKLVCARGIAGRYIGQVGDLVVGCVSEVGHKSWRVDVGGCRRASLALSAVHLPDDAQRIRTREDALSMRKIFDENSVLCAEVQAVRADGTILLHTRSNRYGQLLRGQVVRVKPHLVRRLPRHFWRVGAAQVAVGNNGWVWVQRAIPQHWIDEFGHDELSAEAWRTLTARHAASDMPCDDLARVTASVAVLGLLGAAVNEDTLHTVFAASDKIPPHDMLQPQHTKSFKHALLLRADSLARDSKQQKQQQQHHKQPRISAAARLLAARRPSKRPRDDDDDDDDDL